MGILLLVALVVAILGLMVSGAAFEGDEPGLGVFFLGVGLVGLIAFGAVVSSLTKGDPITDISAGEYRVAFVLSSGDDVSLGLITQDEVKKDHLVYYQFQRTAFEGMVPEKATKLTVVESGDFKKLVLK